MSVYDALSGGPPPSGLVAQLQRTPAAGTNLWLCFSITHAVVCILTLCVAVWQLLITARLRLNFRSLTIALVVLALCLRVLWLIDACACERIYSPALAAFLLRMPSALSLLCLSFLVAMWRRLVTASATLYRITSRVTIGHYKHTLGLCALALGAAVGADVAGAADAVPREVASSVLRVVFGGMAALLAVFGTIAVVHFHQFLTRPHAGPSAPGPSSSVSRAADASRPSHTQTHTRTGSARSLARRVRESMLFAIFGRTTLLPRAQPRTGSVITRTRKSSRNSRLGPDASTPEPGATPAAGAAAATVAPGPALLVASSSGRDVPVAAAPLPSAPAPAVDAQPAPGSNALDASRAVRARIHVALLATLAAGWAAIFVWQLSVRFLSPVEWLVGLWYSVLLEQAAFWTVLGTVWLKPTRKARGIPSARAARRLRNWAYQALLAAKLKGISWGGADDGEGAGRERYKEVWEDEELVRAARVRQALDAGHAGAPRSDNELVAPAASMPTTHGHVPPHSSAVPRADPVELLMQERDLQRLVIERQARELSRIAAEREVAARAERLALRAALELSRQQAVANSQHAANPLRDAAIAAQLPDASPQGALSTAAHRQRVLASMAHQGDTRFPSLQQGSLLREVELASPAGHPSSLEAEMRRVGMSPAPADRLSASFSLDSFEDRFSPDASPSAMVDALMFGESPATDVQETHGQAIAEALRELNAAAVAAPSSVVRPDVTAGMAPGALVAVASLALGAPHVAEAPSSALRSMGVAAEDAAVIQNIIRENAQELSQAAAHVAQSAGRIRHAAGRHRGGDALAPAVADRVVVANPMRYAPPAAYDQGFAALAEAQARGEPLPVEFMAWLTHEWPRSRASSEELEPSARPAAAAMAPSRAANPAQLSGLAGPPYASHAAALVTAAPYVAPAAREMLAAARYADEDAPATAGPAAAAAVQPPLVGSLARSALRRV